MIVFLKFLDTSVNDMSIKFKKVLSAHWKTFEKNSKICKLEETVKWTRNHYFQRK